MSGRVSANARPRGLLRPRPGVSILAVPLPPGRIILVRLSGPGRPRKLPLKRLFTARAWGSPPFIAAFGNTGWRWEKKEGNNGERKNQLSKGTPFDSCSIFLTPFPFGHAPHSLRIPLPAPRPAARPQSVHRGTPGAPRRPARWRRPRKFPPGHRNGSKSGPGSPGPQCS